MVDKLNVIKISQTGNWKKINVMWITLAIHPTHGQSAVRSRDDAF